MRVLKYDIVVYSLPSEEVQEQDSYLKELGINIPPNKPEHDERKARYAFQPQNILEYRETSVTFEKQSVPSVVVLYIVNDKVNETPPLLCSFEQFEKDLEKYYEDVNN
jgi:hypothetical protein